MLVTMILALVITAFAGTVLLHPAFHADLRSYVGRYASSVDPERVRQVVRQISVVVPARNEAESIPNLLRSLDSQRVRPREVIVVDDQSDDGTAEVARSEGANVVAAGQRPPGWLGKPWASFVGGRAAGGRYLLFLDADVTLHSDALEHLAQALLAVAEDCGPTPTLSVQPYHRTVRLRERLAMLFNIEVFVGASRRTLGPLLTMRGSCCFGPCVLCGREEYERFGGYAAVHDRILDDLELGSRFIRAGVPARSFSGRGVVDYRMYPGGVRDLLDGFTKNILLGAQRSGAWFKVLSVLWITGLLAVPYATGVAVTAGNVTMLVIAAVFYVFFAVQIAAAGRRLGNFGPLSALFYPVHLVVFLFVLARAVALSLTGRAVRWKGRDLSARGGA